MKVRIKEWGELAEEFGLDKYGNIKCRFGFSKEMKKYCGRVIEVEDVKFFMYGGWFFNSEMCEIVEKWNKGKMKVRIKEWGELAEEFDLDEDGNIKCRYCIFATGMKEYCGKTIEINKNNLLVTDNTNTFIYDNWFFTNDMYEVIEE